MPGEVFMKASLIRTPIALFSLVLLFAGCEEINSLLGINQKLERPVFLSFQQQYSIEYVRIEWTWPVGSDNFQLMARDATAGGSFMEVFWGNSKEFNFYGRQFPGNALIPGHSYEFKVKALSSDKDPSPYSEIGLYRVPAFLPPTGLAAALASPGHIILSWEAVEEAESYLVYRSASMNGPYSRLYGGTIADPSFEDTTFTPGASCFYKVRAHSLAFGDTDYSIAFWPSSTSSSAISGSIKRGGSGLGGVSIAIVGASPPGTTVTSSVDGGFSLAGIAPGAYTITPSLAGFIFSPPSSSLTVGDSSLSGVDFVATPVVEYSWSDLGTAITDSQADNPGYGFAVNDLRLVGDASGDPILGYLRLGNNSGTLQYAGALRCAYGGWLPLGENGDGSLPASLPDAQPLGFDLSLAAGDNACSLATKDAATVFIHSAAPGAIWSDNLADSNFGVQGRQDDTPMALDVAYLNGELYAAQVESPGYNLKILKWNGAAWAGVGGTAGVLTSSGEVWDLDFANLDGSLYVAYTEDTDGDNFQDLLSIRRWDGASWAPELRWNQKYLGDIRLARAKGDLYFAVGTTSSDYPGGLYRVTGPSAADLVLDGNFSGVSGLAADSAGNLFVLGSTIDLDAMVSVPRIYRWDGSVLAQVTGDYSGKMAGGAIVAIGTDVYYAYGPSAGKTGVGYPTSLKAARLSP
jgi:hypothetical protein